MKLKNYFKTIIKSVITVALVGTVAFAIKTDAHAGEVSIADNVIASYLTESYIEEYGLYEECLGDQFYFYTNVSNGGFTSDAVTFDIPSNMMAAFERNGAPYTYRGSISQLGNYVVRFYGTIGSSTYNANFRFSIREKQEEVAPEPETESIADEFEDVDTISVEDLEASEDDEITDEDINQMIASAEADFAAEEGLDIETDSFTLWGLSESYINDKYVFTLASGEEVYCNVPMGAIVNEGVSIEIPAGMTITVYKDGVEAANESGVDYVYTYTEDGFYKAVFDCKTVNFVNAYPDGSAKPYITFRIVKDPVCDMDYITAPFNAVFTKIGTKSFVVKTEDGDSELAYDNYKMLSDNTYYFGVYDYTSDKHYEFVIERDTTPPEAVTKIEKGRAVTTFKSNDIATIELYKDGIKQTTESVSPITKKGVYRMVITDKAGNVTEKNFELTSYINAGSIIFLILFVLIVVGSIGYIKISKTRMRVR